jgi:hypothetical protein
LWYNIKEAEKLLFYTALNLEYETHCRKEGK